MCIRDRAAGRAAAAGYPCRHPERQSGGGRKLLESAQILPQNVLFSKAGGALLAEAASLPQVAGGAACQGAGHGVIGNA